jgi:oligopeptide transport system substrate-binding protein
MQAPSLGRAIALLLLAALALAPSACRERPVGDVSVVVIGGEPRLRDPYSGPLAAADAVLVANVAQGLVRFDAAGNIVGGVAERWNVSDDGLSYIFRIAATQWPDGSKLTAHQVARVLKRQLATRSKNPLKDTLGAIEDIVAMTDRVIEIRLIAPRPNLLPLLAQPEMAIVRNGHGAGPFDFAADSGRASGLRLTREIPSLDDDAGSREQVLLSGAPAEQAIRAFAAGTAHLVLGGTFLDLPYARRINLPRNSLRFDPAMGLFGLIPARADGLLAEVEARRLLSQAIDRQALVTAFGVPGLAPRATVLETGLDGLPEPVQPTWFTVPMAERRPALLAEAARRFGGEEKPVLRIWLPEGPGGDILLARLAADWGALGLTVERASSAAAADLRLVDAVAPSSSPAWFLRHFRCAAARLCDEEIDKLVDAARTALVPPQRYALLFDAARQIDDAQLFIPLAAPVRWSLVADRIEGFAGNRYARHTLTGLEQSQRRGGL